MDYRNLGRSGLKVSPLCLGAMMFGGWGNPDHEDSIRIIHLGPRTMDQLEDSLKALDVQITEEDARRIDELVPPGTSAL